MAMTPLRRVLLPAAATAVLAAFGAAEAGAGDYDLVKRAPAGANALVLIDVEGLSKSPVAVREKWREKKLAAAAGLPELPRDAKGLLLASKLDIANGFDSQWDVGLIEMTYGVVMETLAKAEGGYVDDVEGLPAAWSPRGAHFVSLTPQILGVMFPANRQEFGRWVRSAKQGLEPQVTPYLKDAILGGRGTAQFAMALDLQDLLAPPQVRAALRKSPTIAAKKVDIDRVAQVIASLKGISCSVKAEDGLYGTLRVDFGEPTDALLGIAKPLLLEALENQGVMIPDFRDWRETVSGRSVSLQGTLSTKGLQTLMSLEAMPLSSLATGRAEGTAANSRDDAKVSPGAKESVRARRSKAYFDEVSGRLDDLRKRARERTLRQLRVWGDKYAKEIDRLPILDVDDELVAYGSQVAQALRNLRNISIGATLNSGYRQTQVFYNYDLQVDTKLIQRQEEYAAMANQTQGWTALENATAEIRRKMTQKYQIEF
jgi:hypothetical protein